MLGAGKTKNLLAKSGPREIDARYFLLLPWAGGFARRVEAGLRHVPLGAQYAAFGTA